MCIRDRVCPTGPKSPVRQRIPARNPTSPQQNICHGVHGPCPNRKLLKIAASAPVRYPASGPNAVSYTHLMRYFENLHPICILCYFVAVIGLTLTCFHPVMLLVSLLGALAFLIRLKGGRGAVRHLSFVIPMSLLVAIANPLINHRGVTLLGMFLNQWITLEAIAYGITAGLDVYKRQIR